jgi:uncharacterized iron-regulated protein
MEANHIEECKDLLKRTRNALNALEKDYKQKKYIEHECQFRMDTLWGILTIAINEIRDMLDYWREDEKQRLANKSVHDDQKDGG